MFLGRASLFLISHKTSREFADHIDYSSVRRQRASAVSGSGDRSMKPQPRRQLLPHSQDDAFPCVQLVAVSAPALVYFIAAVNEDGDLSFGRIVLDSGKRKNLVSRDLVLVRTPEPLKTIPHPLIVNAIGLEVLNRVQRRRGRLEFLVYDRHDKPS